jgi:hypothetical protein
VGDVSQRAHIEIGDALVSQGRPWVLGGDFNAAPDVLREKAGWWLEAVQGVIVQSTEGETCFQAATPTNLDYFFVHRSLAESVRSCSTVTPGPFRPHCAVKLVLNARMGIAPVRVLRQRRAFPRELPIGPRREAAPPSADLQALAAACNGKGRQLSWAEEERRRRKRRRRPDGTRKKQTSENCTAPSQPARTTVGG